MPEYCVTGGTGLIGSYLVKVLLVKGHTVRATVRDPDDSAKVGFLLRLPGAAERLKLLKADLTVAGSFDAAVSGADGVFHSAGPVVVSGSDDIKAALIDPCVNGVANVFSAVAKASTVKRVVFTSSCSAIRYRDDTPTIFSLNESHWSDLDYCKRHHVKKPCVSLSLSLSLSSTGNKKKAGLITGYSLFSLSHSLSDCSLFSLLLFSSLSILSSLSSLCRQLSPPLSHRFVVTLSLLPLSSYVMKNSVDLQLWYALAKTLAEREAWRIAAELGVNLVVVNPSYVVGPVLSPQPTSSLHLILSILKGETKAYPKMTIGFVHIEDVAAAHLLAMESADASGRLICSGEVARWDDIADMLRKEHPSFPIPTKGDDGTGQDNPHSMDTSKIMALGLSQFKTIPQMFADCISSFEENGFL